MRAILRTGLNTTAIALLAAGCGGSMTLEEPTFPEPLVEKLDVSVGLRMSPEMYGFQHEENVLGRETWTVDLGKANAVMFSDLFGHMFSDVRVLDAEDDPDRLPIDALVETSIDDFEFSTPEQTGSESFAVWIRYRLKVFNSDGEMVANWPVSAYGKSETRMLGATKSLEKAALLAMRDAAALMIMKFDKETGIGSLGSLPPPATAEEPVLEPADDASEKAVNADTTSTFAAGGIDTDAI